MYDLELIDTVTRLTAGGSIGVYTKEQLVKELKQLPEEVAYKVSASIFAARKTTKFAKLLEKDDENILRSLLNL